MAIKENAFGLFSMYLHPFIKCFVFLKALNLHLEEIDNNQLQSKCSTTSTDFLSGLSIHGQFFGFFNLFFPLLLLLLFFCFLSFSVTELLLVLATVEPLYKGHLGNRRNWPL